MDATTRIQLAHSQIASDNIRVTGFGAFGPDIEASDIAQGMSALLILKDGALVGAIELPRVGRVDLPYGNKAFGLCHFVHRKVVIDTITGDLSSFVETSSHKGKLHFSDGEIVLVVAENYGLHFLITGVRTGPSSGGQPSRAAKEARDKKALAAIEGVNGDSTKEPADNSQAHQGTEFVSHTPPKINDPA